MVVASTVNPAEAAHFGALAKDWWDPKGSSAMLHRLNPARLAYLREAIDSHWDLDSALFDPLAGRTALDVGCGAGLLTEPLVRLGARATGLDAAPENIGAARAHAEALGLDVEYLAGGIESVAGRRFDLVVSMEVVEHVADTAAFAQGLAAALAENGLLILSTPNRTLLSHMALIAVGEGIGAIPKGTHDWRQFLRPEELTELLAGVGLEVTDVRGLGFSPARGFVLSEDTSLDYLVSARRG